MRALNMQEMSWITGGDGDENVPSVVISEMREKQFDMEDLLWNVAGAGGSGFSDEAIYSEGGGGNYGSVEPEPDKNTDYAKQKAAEYNKAMDKWRADVAAEKVRAQQEADKLNAQYAAECTKLRFDAQNYIAGILSFPEIGALVGDWGARNSVLCARVAVPTPREIPMPQLSDFL